MTREEAIEKLKLYDNYFYGIWRRKDKKYRNVFDMAIEALQAEPVKHGKWEIVKLNNYNAVACSECGEPSVAETPYCSYCGAKMDKE